MSGESLDDLLLRLPRVGSWSDFRPPPTPIGTRRIFLVEPEPELLEWQEMPNGEEDWVVIARGVSAIVALVPAWDPVADGCLPE